MSIADLLAACRTPASLCAGHCGSCDHFDNDAASVEAMLPGVTAMGSAYASVRASDGVCALRGLYLSDRAGCDRFQPVTSRRATTPVLAPGET